MVMKGAACLILLFHLSLSPHYNSTEPRTPPAYLDKPIWMDNTFSSTYKGLSLKEQSPPAPTKPFIIAALYSFVFGWIISITWPKKPFFRGRKIDRWILSVGQVKCQKRSHHRIYLESHLKAELHNGGGAFLTLAQSSMPLILESRMGGLPCNVLTYYSGVTAPRFPLIPGLPPVFALSSTHKWINLQRPTNKKSEGCYRSFTMNRYMTVYMKGGCKRKKFVVRFLAEKKEKQSRGQVECGAK